MNTPSYKYNTNCIPDCYTYLNTLTINIAGTECITKAACIAADVVSNDLKNCLSDCPDGKKGFNKILTRLI